LCLPQSIFALKLMNLLKNLLKNIIAPIIVVVVGGYSLYHFTKQDESREINPHSNSGIINNMNTTYIILIQLYSGTVTRVSRFTRADRCTIATCSNQGTPVTVYIHNWILRFSCSNILSDFCFSNLSTLSLPAEVYS
jgi:hypothetical protein